MPLSVDPSPLRNFSNAALVGTTFFEEMGFHYLGPVDGHDVKRLTELLRKHQGAATARFCSMSSPKRAEATRPAEEKPDLYHGIGPFDPETGTPSAPDVPTFSSTFGILSDAIWQRRTGESARSQQRCSRGRALDIFAQLFPERFFDVGIAEAHGVLHGGGACQAGDGSRRGHLLHIFAAGIRYAAARRRAFAGCMWSLPLTGRVWWANDGETHHGVFDVAYLQQIPGMHHFGAQQIKKSCEQMLKTAIYDDPRPRRHPLSYEAATARSTMWPTDPVLRTGEDLTLVTYGTMINTALEAAALLAPQGISVEVLKLSQIAPLGP